MYHSLTIGGKNTWDDWHLVPTERPVISFPEYKKKTVELNSGNGYIDLSEKLTGGPTFNNAQGTFQFYMMNDYGDTLQRYSEILNHLHGKTMTMTMEDVPGESYRCRFNVSAFTNSLPCPTVSIAYLVINQ